MFGVSDWTDVKAVKRRRQNTPSAMMTNSSPTVPHGRGGDSRRRNLVVLSQSPRHRSEVSGLCDGYGGQRRSPQGATMKVRSFVIVLFVLAIGFTVCACGSSPTSASNVTSVAVTGAVPAIGSSSQFDAMATLSGGTTQDVSSTATWTSSNTAVATVSSTGVVTAVATGSVTITATYSGVAGNDALTVQ